MFTTPTEPTSVRLWPTPAAADAERGSLMYPGNHNPTLLGAVRTASPTSTSSQAASPASPSASLDAVRSRTTIVGYGPSSPDAFASYDPATSSWKTSQASFWGEEWTTYSEGWPSSGMTRNGRAFRRRPLVPRTSATASGSSGPNSQGLWPTPVAAGDHATPYAQGGMSLGYAARLPDEMWHTPTASDKDGRPRWDHRASPGHVRKVPVPNLMAQVLERWPTPTTRDYKDTGDAVLTGAVPVNGLLGRAVEPSKVGGSLNPAWVELLMGFPAGWTELGDPDGRTESTASPSESLTASTDSEPSGMPWFPKSSNGSGDASSKRKRRP
jgi:hypothetical protein